MLGLVFAILNLLEDRPMEIKPKELFVSAVLAITLGTFAFPFGSNAAASTGTQAPSQNQQLLLEYAQDEHHDVEEHSEHKDTESSSDDADRPQATEQEHEEHETTEVEHHHHGRTHKRHHKADVDEMHRNTDGSGETVSHEHEEHKTSEQSEHN
jgi:hypothetical protein